MYGYLQTFPNPKMSAGVIDPPLSKSRYVPTEQPINERINSIGRSHSSRSSSSLFDDFR